MSRDWSKEPYRKQLLRPSPSFRMLSVSAQGLFYVLMREADDDGYLPFASDFDDGCVRLRRLLGVHNEERRGLPKHLKDLLTDGCVQHVGDRLHLRSLRVINERRDRSGGGRQTDSGEGPGRPRAPRPAERQPSVGGALAEHSPSVGGALAEHSPSVGGALAEHSPSIDQGANAGNHSGDQRNLSRARARLQVGREVGREAAAAAAEPPPPVEVAETRSPDSGPADADQVLAELHRVSIFVGRSDVAMRARRLAQMAAEQGNGRRPIAKYVAHAVDRLASKLADEPMQPSRALNWAAMAAESAWRERKLEGKANGTPGRPGEISGDQWDDYRLPPQAAEEA